VQELVLVRHAMPEIRRDLPPERWHLDAEGKAAARELAQVLPVRPLMLTSPEPKARETAEELLAVRGGSLRLDERLAEARRDTPYSGLDDYRRLAEAYVAGVAHPGWEPRAALATRIAGAVQDGRAAAGHRALVIVSHGLTITAWLTSEVGLRDPAAFWAALRLPDAWRVGGGRAERAERI
jgi:broad specificity phosphatase PhoE